jgi:hypothetical protein
MDVQYGTWLTIAPFLHNSAGKYSVNFSALIGIANTVKTAFKSAQI